MAEEAAAAEAVEERRPQVAPAPQAAEQREPGQALGRELLAWMGRGPARPPGRAAHCRAQRRAAPGRVRPDVSGPARAVPPREQGWSGVPYAVEEQRRAAWAQLPGESGAVLRPEVWVAAASPDGAAEGSRFSLQWVGAVWVASEPWDAAAPLWAVAAAGWAWGPADAP